MNTVERLVRNLCDERQKAITAEASAQLEDRLQPITVSRLPMAARRAIVTIIRLRVQLKAAEQELSSRGFKVSDDSNAVHLAYDQRRRLTDEIEAAHKARLRGLSELKTGFTVMTLDKTVKQAKPMLEQLQRALAKL